MFTFTSLKTGCPDAGTNLTCVLGVHDLAAEIVWESEVWIADFPEHMIHFNGDKFLGPYPQRVTDDRSEDEKEQWDALEWNEDGVIPDAVDAGALNQWLFNTDTVDKVLAHLMTKAPLKQQLLR